VGSAPMISCKTTPIASWSMPLTKVPKNSIADSIIVKLAIILKLRIFESFYDINLLIDLT
jgi:hypothetical protein